MPVILPTATNYSWIKNKKNAESIKSARIISCFSWLCDDSMWLVAITDNGANVNISKSLLLFGEMTNITTPIKNEATNFLYDGCNNCGLPEIDSTIVATKYIAMLVKIESARFSFIFLK